jgi:hypothetical protein
VPRPKRAQEGVLHDIVRVGFVARQRERKAIHVVNPRNGLVLKGDSALTVSIVGDLHVSE